jgi:Na+/melibiose symporter-like transporter
LPRRTARWWNAVNDPVFGWLSDKLFRRRRTDAIRTGGLLWSAVFALMWLPLWPPPQQQHAQPSRWHDAAAGLYFLLILCVYDGALTFVEVNHSALLAEITSSPMERVRFNMWSGVCAGLGSLTSMLAHAAWDVSDATRFRVMAAVVAAGTAAVFVASTRYLSRSRSAPVATWFGGGLDDDVAGQLPETSPVSMKPFEADNRCECVCTCCVMR